MTNFQKRLLTSLIIFPISIFFIIKGGYFLLFFLFLVFFIANYELFKTFKKILIIFFLDLILILSLFSIYSLRDAGGLSYKLLLWLIILSIFSDTGGYFFGKTFKWIKISKISPNKTLSGVLGSFIFSILSLFIAQNIPFMSDIYINFLDPNFFFLAIIFSIVVQTGDLIISFFKRLEKIKDAGKILPGHGGIFDRIDGLMFAVILGYFLISANLII